MPKYIYTATSAPHEIKAQELLIWSALDTKHHNPVYLSQVDFFFNIMGKKKQKQKKLCCRLCWGENPTASA